MEFVEVTGQFPVINIILVMLNLVLFLILYCSPPSRSRTVFYFLQDLDKYQEESRLERIIKGRELARVPLNHLNEEVGIVLGPLHEGPPRPEPPVRKFLCSHPHPDQQIEWHKN